MVTEGEYGVKLKDCPLCGKSPEMKTNNNAKSQASVPQFWVKCITLDCGISPIAALTQGEAVDRWNRRK